MEPLSLTYEESQSLDELENQYCSMGPADLLAAHDQWLREVDVEYEKCENVD